MLKEISCIREDPVLKHPNGLAQDRGHMRNLAETNPLFKPCLRLHSARPMTHALVAPLVVDGKS